VNEQYFTIIRRTKFRTERTDYNLTPSNHTAVLDEDGEYYFTLPGLTQFSKVTAAFAQNESVGGTLFVSAQGVATNGIGYANIKSMSIDDAGKKIIITVHTL
jgi:hypothetical protein